MNGFHSAILKLTSVCNLNCTYCYMFNLADKTYHRMPAMMSVETALQVLDRIAAHLDESDHRAFSITLHGGEPTMWPYDRFVAFLDGVETFRKRGYRIDVSMQTNGYKVDPALFPLLAAHAVSLGISIDGPRAHHDRFRIDHAGRGSHDRVMATVHSMVAAGHAPLIGGFLTVAQPELSPSEFLAWADALPIRRVDVLWPIEFHHGNPPWGAADQDAYTRAPRYGRWFADLFDQWWERDDPDLYIRLFFQVIERMLGSTTHIDALVNDELSMFVVNTDGAFEYPDYFRAFRDGGAATPFSVSHHGLRELLADPGFGYCVSLGEHLPGECRGCPHVDICGGGFLPGRMKADEWPPKQKSILCADQLYFFSHVEQRVRPLVARSHVGAAGDRSGMNVLGH